MSASTAHPDPGRLVALLDGELSVADAASVRQHVAGCDACRDVQQEMLSVRAMLSSQPAPSPLRPVWPAVRDRLSPRPRLTPTFAFGAALAALAGVFLGLSLDASRPVTPSDDPMQESLWTDVGASWGADTGLYDLYFGGLEETTP